ncbi:creatininase family protein [Elioraea sp.]|uniref:creatininase family protein n=1 Tax=Elioraea sp. TaxID=2185103 RepID=UPI0025BF5521|nr:creatininase family protein [Elioraea sp.]
MQRKLKLAELTSAEARERFTRRPVILLPLGSLEEQGPHAPMGDYLLAERLAVMMAERAVQQGAEALVAPVIPFGYADWFRPVPGGIALRRETLSALLEDTLDSLMGHGLDRVLIVNGHSGNNPTIDEVTRGIKRRGGALVPCLHIWRALAAKWPAFAGDVAKPPPGALGPIGHGADPVWSVALALFPELCRPDLMAGPVPPPPVLGLKVTGFGAIRFEDVEVTVPLEIDDIAPSGVSGANPAFGNAETGARAATWLAETGARLIAHLRAAR